ncbi:hypothetical protein [Novosphingobium aerophilum]|uniref:Uncharacterized protein n=1 Tax=Novosphingobium aerophilum TaxID=2839843 RepID=A0A7X1F8H7_9SPHN|nr:hypothetical protein [Novosphingobium aerophilum]MBC2652358.1 hypothetical protein [Novosphingobium aerophilum]
MAGWFFNVAEQQEQVEAAAGALLDEVRRKLRAEFPSLDNVGADAVMLNALVIRAGRNRYYFPTLAWLVQAAYEHGHRPYESPITASICSGIERSRYSPFDFYHRLEPPVDVSDEEEPVEYPDHLRPLRFLARDLYQWEQELGTSNENTHRLYRGEDVDGDA